MRRHRAGMIISVAMTVAISAAAEKKPSKAASESNQGNIFTLVTLQVKTNADGQVSEALVQGSSTYALLTNGMSAETMNALLGMNDHLVNLRGEVVQDGDKACLKPIGRIKDASPSLRSVFLQIETGPKGELSNAMITTGEPNLVYHLDFQALNEVTQKSMIPMKDKFVAVDGEISQSRMLITNIRSVKLAAKKTDKKKGKQ